MHAQRPAGICDEFWFQLSAANTRRELRAYDMDKSARSSDKLGNWFICYYLLTAPALNLTIQCIMNGNQ